MDYSRNGTRTDGEVEFLRNENKYLQQDVEKYKAQCIKLNEEIEHLHDRLADADRIIDRLSREKEELAKSCPGKYERTLALVSRYVALSPCQLILSKPLESPSLKKYFLVE